MGNLFSVSFFIVCLLFSSTPMAKEPLVKKTQNGQYQPAAALQWTQASENSFRFVLKKGNKASDIAEELREKIAPIEVRVQDDFTLLFQGEKLTEATLLEALSGIPLPTHAEPSRNALAALSRMESEDSLSLRDLSGGESIRANKQLDHGGETSSQSQSDRLVGKVLRVQHCGPMPTVTVEVLSFPRDEAFRKEFQRGKRAKIRGYFRTVEKTGLLDGQDERTQQNLKTKQLKWGQRISGKPLAKEQNVWILETINIQPGS